MALIACPECTREISTAAASCPGCGHPMQRQVPPPLPMQTQAPAQPKWHPGVAAVLSLVIPGAGQMYKGQVLNGIVWLVCVAIGYVLFVVPGLILHLFCILGAASGDPNK